MKFQTLFAAALGPLAFTFTTVTARDINNGTAIPTNGTTVPINNGTAVPINNGTAVSTHNDTALSTNNGAANLHCDATCAHHLIFLSGYNAARDGYRMVLDAYDGYDWCFNDAKGWCPDAINLTTTRIASQIKTDVTVGVDYNNIKNLTLLSTVLTVNARSRRTAISVAQSLMESSPLTCPNDRITELEKMRWLMAQQEAPIDYDADEFDQLITNQDGETLEKRSWNACKGNPVMCSNMPYLRRLVLGARKLLSKLKYKLLRSAIDEPVPLNPIERMVTDYNLEEWRAGKGPKGTENWLDEVADPFEPVPEDVLANDIGPESFEPPDFPLDFGKGVPADDIPYGMEPRPIRPPPPRPPPGGPPPRVPDSVGPPVEPPPPPPPPVVPPPAAPGVPPAPPVAQGAQTIGLFRAEMFDSLTGTLKQVTVRPGIITETQALIMEELRDVGVRPYEVLDSVGNPIQTTWLKPSDFVSTPGRWAERGEQFVREQLSSVAGRMEPVLNGLGEPLVASAEGTLMTLAPVALRPAQAGAVGVLEGAANAMSSVGSAFFDLFKPEGGRPRKSRVIFNQMDGSVDIRDPSAPPEAAPEDTGDQQNNDELDEKKSEHSETNESEHHENADKDEYEKPEDKDGKTNELEDTQTKQTTTPQTNPPETTAPEPTAAERPTEVATPNTDTLNFANPDNHLLTTASPPNAPPTAKLELTQTMEAPKQESIPHWNHKGNPSEGPSPPLPTIVESPIPSTKAAKPTKSVQSVVSTKSDTSDLSITLSTTLSLHLKSDYLVPHTISTPKVVHKSSQVTETQHQTTSNPYPYPDSHLPMTFPDPTMTDNATEAMKTHSSNIYPYPDNHPLLTSKKEMDGQTTTNLLPFPNSHIPKTFPAPTKAHDATEAMKTQTLSNVYPYPDNYKYTLPTPNKECNGVYPYPDNYCYPSSTTFATVTKSSNLKTSTSTSISSTTSNTSKTSTSTSAKPGVTTIAGCQSNSDCPVCTFDTSCQIGNLPPECVRNAVNIDNVAISGNYTWDDCVDKIRKLDKYEAKAWAIAITSPVCLSENEWGPREMDREHGGECWLDVRGDEFARVKDAWITGLLPLRCPWYEDVDDGNRDEELKLDHACKKAIDVLSRPWRED